ncbi:citrate synthase/methylcitrate synthase [Sphingobium nicotianae]|uniref:citrate synthase (unknown stereospecificity) n=1 Tax=Sphingobium nicotianae TaxID=2782607 RepID=A0A9X1DF48_9SPHN|nr:citrate synthase/methylcitrate synthase [Sphingobium nicotianae]MBT2188766.1 citrate synthase/methylcitrate synthase [Sphingobium nicotianae]
MAGGLDDVIAAETVLSDVDGAAGRLVIRGHALSEIAGSWTFEQVLALLFDGFFTDLPDEAALRRALGEARVEVGHGIAPLLPELAALGPFDGMRAGVALLPDGAGLGDALRLIAAPAVLLPAIVRLQAGQATIAPDADLPHAADMIRMLTDEASGPKVAALETYLATVCDHGLNASTFAARVVASTGAGLMSCALAALSALKGPLHGGAPGPVIEMLDAIAQAGDARGWLTDLVRSGGRIMGFGHRIYRVRDPRADALKAAVRRLAGSAGDARLRFAEEVERTALGVLRAHKPGRVLQTNVEFYTALLLEAVGFPPDAFTAVFAAGRMTGWLAHAREQALTGRLIRPRSSYIGPQTDLAA